MSGLRWWCVLVMCLGAVVQVARADGKAFVLRAQDPGSVRMPDQQALICFDNGIETLAIETRFMSKGTDFAWVIPLPAEPTIEAATEGLFPTLQALFQPKVISEAPRALGLLIPLILVTLILIGTPRWRGLVMALLVVFFAALALLPALGKARGGGAAFGGVEVLSRTIAGEFELTTIASEDPAAMVKWLNEGGYAVPEGAAPVIADYVAKGWVFVAARAVAPETIASGAVTPRPLVFRFPVAAPVYPMRLTGVENGGSLELELFVFGPASAKVEGMEVSTTLTACVKEAAYQSRSWPNWSEIGVSHAGLREVLSPPLSVKTPLWGTKLTGTLDASQMRSDLAVEFAARAPMRAEVYSPTGRLKAAISTAAGVVLLGLWIAFFGFEAKRAGSRARLLGVAVAFAVGVLSGVVHGALLPVTESSMRVGYLDGYRLLDTVHQELWSHPRQPNEDDLARLRGAAERSLEQLRADGRLSEVVIAGLREGDSPGSYEFRKVEEDVWTLVWHDWFGAELLFEISDLDEATPEDGSP